VRDESAERVERPSRQGTMRAVPPPRVHGDERLHPTAARSRTRLHRPGTGRNVLLPVARRRAHHQTQAAGAVMQKYQWLDALCDTPGLPHTTFRVAVVLARYANSTDGRNARPGHARIATGAGISERSVRRHLSALEDLGWISQTRRGAVTGHRNLAAVYALALPQNDRPKSNNDRPKSTNDRPDLCPPTQAVTPLQLHPCSYTLAVTPFRVLRLWLTASGAPQSAIRSRRTRRGGLDRQRGGWLSSG